MKRAFVIATLFVLACAFNGAMNYIPTDESSSVKFKIKNLGIIVDGSLKGLKGAIEFDPARPDAARFDVTVDANTINTGIRARDKHIKKEEYFDVAKYSTLKFTATKIAASSGANNFIVSGNLTIKNITKAISFPFTATLQNNGYLFKGEFKINRRDYSVGGSSITMSDNLTVFLEIFAKKG
ncbi:YceI family protein [soil metagenome]